jgi:hypothetical protein
MERKVYPQETAVAWRRSVSAASRRSRVDRAKAVSACQRKVFWYLKRMHRRAIFWKLFCASVLLSFARPGRAESEPQVVDPGPPPGDAIVLFDGRDLSQWQAEGGGQARWEVKDGVAIVNKTGSLMTKLPFGDCQLHIEWATPAAVSGDGQGRGNSGVIFQGRYELQILDSYQNKTYFNGQAGALYSQYAPLVNVSRKPGEWQSYDVIFHAPRFDQEGKLLQPGTMTVLQNGVLVQDHVEIKGLTALQPPKYVPHPPKLPLVVQDHGNPIRFRNIWIREL